MQPTARAVGKRKEISTSPGGGERSQHQITELNGPSAYRNLAEIAGQATCTQARSSPPATNLFFHSRPPQEISIPVTNNLY